jgi:hypothetical protein
MAKAFAIFAAYLVACAVVPPVFLTLDSFWHVPTPDGLRFGSLIDLFLVGFVGAAMSGLPGFALARLGLWWFGAQNPVFFVAAGSFTGVLAAAVICFPYHLQILWTHGLGLIGAAVGGAASLVYWQAERLLTGRRAIGRSLRVLEKSLE